MHDQSRRVHADSDSEKPPSQSERGWIVCKCLQEVCGCRTGKTRQQQSFDIPCISRLAEHIRRYAEAETVYAHDDPYLHVTGSEVLCEKRDEDHREHDRCVCEELDCVKFHGWLSFYWAAIRISS